MNDSRKAFLIFILSVLTLTVSAQIQRSFLGNVLGVSTYDQVRANMRDKGYHISSLFNKDCAVYRDVKFAGYNCEEVYFHFYDNKFYLVCFVLEETNLEDKDTYDSLRLKLINKYPDYKQDENKDVIKFFDSKTLLALRYEFSRNTAKQDLSISYWDFNLANTKIIKDINERNSDEEL